MIKSVLWASITVLFLVGCTINSQEVDIMPKTRCLDGVVYYLFTIHPIPSYAGYGFMSPKFNRNNTVEICDEH